MVAANPKTAEPINSNEELRATVRDHDRGGYR